MKIVQEDGVIRVERPSDEGFHRSLHGLTRTLIANMVEGVTKGYEKRLAIVGVGYRASMKGKALELAVGFSHPVRSPRPPGIEFEVPTPTQIVVRGNDKQQVARSPPTSARSASPSPTRARASATRTSTSARRPARPRRERVMDAKTKRAGPRAPHARVRKKIAGTPERPRLAVYRSNRHIYAQLDRRRARRTRSPRPPTAS